MTQLPLFVQHQVVAKADIGHGMLRVECSCGYWQQVRWMAFFPRLWVEEHASR